MSGKGSHYENLYTQQISEALDSQPGYESKRAAEKKKLQEEAQNVKRNVRAFGGFLFVAFLGACGYLINLDPANAGPCAVALVVFLIVSGVIYVMNK